MGTESIIRSKYELLSPALNERNRRLWAGTEARALGRGGIALVQRATGLAYETIRRGMQELEAVELLPPDRVRLPGGGRKRATQLQPGLAGALDRLVEPLVRGDPESPLRWTCKSTRRLATELQGQGFAISHTVVASLLHDQHYSLQANRKTQEGTHHADRNAQFEHINGRVRSQLEAGQPAVSVDTKKKELVGNFKQAGREWRPQGQPVTVNVHDFPHLGEGKAIPYGVYDLGRNQGWVSVGIDHDTAAFAVTTLRRWWREMGRRRYPQARSLLVVADNGGSNGARVRLWKWELQRLADRIGLPISVCHFPPGTSKWNKIEHRLFSFISQNWRGHPLLTHTTIVNLIAETKTETGLKVRCVLDAGKYPTEQTVTDAQMATVRITRDEFHGEWNYAIHPRNH